MPHTKLRAVLLFAVVAIGCAAGHAFTQEAQAVVGPTEQIKAGFKSYSLFLICDPGWLLQSEAGGSHVAWLYGAFERFGDAIGDDNLAVWFWKGPAREPTADRVDLKRSARFCKAWRLLPSASPYVVITTSFPDERNLSNQLPPENCVFTLGGMTQAQASSLFSKLTDRLLLGVRVQSAGAGTPAGNSPAQTPGLWVRLLTAVQQSINEFGCAWTVKIDAGAVKADLHSCQTKPE
jgi:hypothetical protein